MKLKLNQSRPGRELISSELIDLIVKNNADIINALLESAIYPNAGEILIKTGNKRISIVSEWKIKSFVIVGGHSQMYGFLRSKYQQTMKKGVRKITIVISLNSTHLVIKINLQGKSLGY